MSLRNIFLLFLFIPSVLLSQTHTIDKHNMQMSGYVSDYDISVNTFYNTLDTCNISWVVIKDSIPPEWGYSFCFPNCYAQGVNNAQILFLPGENNYLNCHIYPNGKVGEGVIQMEITTNNIYKDTITWTGVIFSTSSINKLDVLNSSEVSQIYDISGRKVDELKNSGIYIIEYSNNIRQKFRYIY